MLAIGMSVPCLLAVCPCHARERVAGNYSHSPVKENGHQAARPILQGLGRERLAQGG